MKIGYNYFYEREELQHILKQSHLKEICEYIYSPHAVIKISHFIENKGVKFDYFIFDFIYKGKSSYQEKQLLKTDFLHHDIQRKMEFFMGAINSRKKSIFDTEIEYTYAKMMYSESLYKERHAYTLICDKFVYLFKAWSSFNHKYTLFSNIWYEENHHSRLSNDYVVTYQELSAEKTLKNIIVEFINDCIEGVHKKKQTNNHEELNKVLNNVLLKLI